MAGSVGFVPFKSRFERELCKEPIGWEGKEPKETYLEACRNDAYVFDVMPRATWQDEQEGKDAALHGMVGTCVGGEGVLVAVRR